MTAPDELQRAVERLTAHLTANHAMTLGGAVVRTSDLRLLLSERAELLAAVERMRGLLKKTTDVLSSLNKSTDRPSNYVSHLVTEARAALTTGEEG